MTKLVVVGRTKSPLVEKIAARLNAPVVGFHLDWFADTEPSLTLNSQIPLANVTALVVFHIDLFFDEKNTCRSINDYVAGLLHLLHAIKQEGTSSIITVLPYLPYARQEKDITAKYPGPLNLWATILKTAGINQLIACDIHSSESAACLGPMLHEITLAPFWAKHIREIIPTELDIKNNLILVSPDRGGVDRVAAIAQELGCMHTFVDKIRLSKDNPIALGLTGKVDGRVAVIIDDILDTAKTAANACQLLHTHGVRSVFGCFTHAIFSPGAHQRLAHAGFEKILITDSLTSAIKQVGAHLQVCSIADYMAERICENVKN